MDLKRVLLGVLAACVIVAMAGYLVASVSLFNRANAPHAVEGGR